MSTDVHGLVKMTSEGLELPTLGSFTVIGDPGCDGLGAETMSIFARALKTESPDFGLIIGDLVPFGSRALYRNVCDFVNTIAPYPVYTLPGNHDTDHYGEFFGRGNYWLTGSGLLLIVLDNSIRSFSRETLEFLERTLKDRTEPHVIVSFHIPPPNNVSGNSVSVEEWSRVERILEPQRDRIRFLVCGHLHSYFQDLASGYPLIVTGGGGARIEEVEGEVDPALAYHHIILFDVDPNGVPTPRHVPLKGLYDTEAADDPKLAGYLMEAFRGETAARSRYELASAEAFLQGLPGLAQLFRAAADAEGIHARNLLRVIEGWPSPMERLDNGLAGEHHEIDMMYREFDAYAVHRSKGLSHYAFHDAREAEKIHAGLFEEAKKALESSVDVPESSYWTCTSCGQTFRSDQPPGRCPVCGAPRDKIREVSSLNSF